MKQRFRSTSILSLLIFLTLAYASTAGAYPQMTKTTFDVANLSCGSCLSRIYGAIGSLEGFVSMAGDIRAGKVSVVHRDSLESQTIADAITDIGYPAQVSQSEVVDGVDLGSGGTRIGGGCCRGLASDATTTRPCSATLSSWKRLYNYCSGIIRGAAKDANKVDNQEQ